MTSKRKAEIQRKLSLTAVPRPPADLLDRIKGDIPRYLSVEAERARFSRTIGFNLRVAASIIVLISVAAALFMLVPQNQPSAITAMKESAPPAPKPVPTAIDTASGLSAPVAAADEVRVDIVQAATPPPRASAAPSELVRNEGSTRQELALARDEERGVEGGVEGGIAGGVVGGVAGGIVSTPEPQRQVAEYAPVPPPSAVAPAPVPVVEAPPPPASISVTAEATALRRKTAASSSLVPPAFADDLNLAPKSVFGISVDSSVFRRIRTTIESGARPSPSSADVEALVNYFAGAPSRRVKRGVRLEAEASPAPVDANGKRGILRLTIDTAMVDVPQRGSVPPIGSDAKLEIEFNSDAVERYEAIGDHSTLTPERALLHNTSVTGLYALELRTPLKARQRVATVRLRYRSLPDGKQHTIV
ncbi:MAG TPA: von Willebrand factor type A domain-containing protein, partial [Thermoanaerobaculia bacterium]|nr:von Willebrand factor type A domain-containing protein [Thermoanaerobaculia bacterium]